MDFTSFNETRRCPDMILTFDMLIEAISEWEGDWCYLIQKLEKCKWNFAEKVRDVYLGRNGNVVSVLNHCDMHFKNMLFLKVEDQMKDVLLVSRTL